MTLPDTMQRRPSGYDSSGLLTDSEAQVVVASGNSTTPLRVGKGATFEVNVTASAISGTSPTLDFLLECSDDEAFGTSVTVAEFPQVDDSQDPSEQQMAFRSEGTYVRGSWVVAGTNPSFTLNASLRA